MLHHHRKTHSVLIRHLQESNLPPRDTGLDHQTTALGLNVFIYSYHIETRSPEWTLPRPTVGSVFLYGRTTRTRTGIDRLKADYSTFEL